MVKVRSHDSTEGTLHGRERTALGVSGGGEQGGRSERKAENEGTDRCALALGDNIAKYSRGMRHRVAMSR